MAVAPNHPIRRLACRRRAVRTSRRHAQTTNGVGRNRHARPARCRPNASDSAGIRAAALDYIEGWYTGNPVRMERALHPELAKRIVRTDSASGKSVLSQMGAKQLVD